MEELATFTTYLFNLFILYNFLKQTIRKRYLELPSIVYVGSFLLVELMIFLTGTLTDELPDTPAFFCNAIISFLTTVCLCFLFQSSLKQKLFISLLFQTFTLLSKGIAILLIKQFNPAILMNPSVPRQTQMTIYNLISKCVLSVLCLLFLSFWNKEAKRSFNKYPIIILVTPIISLIILLSIPYSSFPNPEQSPFFYILFICLNILNVTNYIMLNKIFLSTEFKKQYQQMEQQIIFQKEKYKQLSTAYQETRSIVHDVRKHYFAIQELIKHQEYEQLLGYTSSAINTLENTYANINTGNLVIDSFVSNYQNMALQENIHFETTIQIDPNKIPLNDYDLCVILGNMLDNCLNACRNNSSAENHIHLQITMDKQNCLLIHTINSYQNVSLTVSNIKQNIDLYHGFGLKNIKKIAEIYHGMCYTKAEQDFQVYVVIPIIK